MWVYRAGKKPQVQRPQPAQLAKYQHNHQHNHKQGREKLPQQLQRAPQVILQDFIPLYKPNATPISDTSMLTNLNQFKKVYKHFTKVTYK